MNTNRPTLSDLSDRVAQAIAIMSEPGITEDGIEARVLMVAGEEMLARRLIDWIREAFGLILVGHIAKFNLPQTFKAKHGRRRWLEFPFKAEPIFELAACAAVNMVHSDSREAFLRIANCSSSAAVVTQALDAGVDAKSLDGMTLAPPHMLGIPATQYGASPLSWWRRLLD